MDQPSTQLLQFILVVGVQLAGIASVAVMRTGATRSWRFLGQTLFFGLLLLVGVTAMVSAGLGQTWWAGCGATLSAMVVGAVFDPSGSAHRTAT